VPTEECRGREEGDLEDGRESHYDGHLGCHSAHTRMEFVPCPPVCDAVSLATGPRLERQGVSWNLPITCAQDRNRKTASDGRKQDSARHTETKEFLGRCLASQLAPQGAKGFMIIAAAGTVTPSEETTISPESVRKSSLVPKARSGTTGMGRGGNRTQQLRNPLRNSRPRML
jgi:hypothetical protein